MTAVGQPCVAGIVFALAIEADAFERRVTGRREWRGPGPTFHEGTIAGGRVGWCVAGVGGPAAARATGLLIDGHRPRAVISAGFAGGLDAAFARGAVVRATAVVTEAAGDRIPLAVVGDQGGGPLLVSVAEVAGTVDRKRDLAARTGAGVVDMETHAVATAAAAAGLPCHCVRVISDDAAQTLPPEAMALARPQSAARRFGTVLGALGRRPTVVGDLWRLYEHAVVDGRTLAAALEELCGALAAAATAGRPGAGPAGSAAGPAPAP